MSHSPSCTLLDISSHSSRPQLFLNNTKNQLEKTHVGFDNHRDIYLYRDHLKNVTK